MHRVKLLAWRYLSDGQVRVLRRWLHAWRERGSQAARRGYTVSDLRNASRQLWAGHTATASRFLQQVLETPAAPRSHRSRAAFQLAKLRASDQEWSEVNTLLTAEAVRYLGGLDKGRAHVLRAVAAMELGDIAAAEEALDHPAVSRTGKQQHWLLRANLEAYRLRHSGEPGRMSSDEQRLECVNRIYRYAGLTEICRRDSDRALDLNNIKAREGGSPPRLDGEKVSVLVPCFNAEGTIRFALDSILAQTHRNVEILCVDDCSSDETRAIVHSYVEAGAPVTLLVNERNSGPYHSRNRALQQASGEFVTVHDADDWMHPQRIEAQLNHLRSNRRIEFSFTRLARVADGFLFTLRPFRPMLEPIHWNYTSIMGRHHSFLALGGWDPVVAHADAEFIDRIKDRLGEQALGECLEDVPMALFTDGAANLTKRAGTGLTSVGFGARREYQEQAREWRRAGALGLWSGGVIERKSGRDPFFVPNALLPGHLKRDTRYDFVFVTDMSLLGGTRRCNLEYFRVCVERGWKVGVFNHARYGGRLAGTIDEEYRRLFDRGEVDLLTPEDSVDAGAVIVHHPPILAAPIDRYPAIRTSTVALLVNQLPYQSTLPGAEMLYEPSQVEADVKSRFGCSPVWIPISGLVRARLGQFVPSERLFSDTWYPVVAQRGERGRKTETDEPHAAKLVRVGRHSRDDATKWPENPQNLRQIYPKAKDIEVHILGGADTVCGGRGRIPRNWHVHPFDSISVPAFLAGLDVFIHWPRADYIEEFGRNVAEAMACGVPCILSRDLESTFGDAALYPDAADVEKTVRELAMHTQCRRDLVARGWAFIAENCSADVAGERMERLLRQRADIFQRNAEVAVCHGSREV